MANKEDLKVGDRVKHTTIGEGKVLWLFSDRTRVTFDNELDDDLKKSLYYDDTSNGLSVNYADLTKINDTSEQTDLVRLNSSFTSNQLHTMGLVIQKHGENKQSLMACEELAELIQAVSKVRRKYNRETLDNLVEEIADAMIMIEQLKIMYNLDMEDIEDIIDLKMKRLKEGLENGKNRLIRE